MEATRESFAPEQGRKLEEILPELQEMFDTAKALFSRESSQEKGKNALSFEGAMVRTQALMQLKAIEAAGTLARELADEAAKRTKEVGVRYLDVMEAGAEAIFDPEKTLREKYVDLVVGPFKNVASSAAEWLRGYAHGLPKDKKNGTTESERASVAPFITETLASEKVRHVVENVFALNDKGMPWDLPAYLFQRFHSKPNERNAILLEGFEGATKSEKVSRVLERIRSSEHLTDDEIDAIVAEIKTFSDAELVSGDVGAKGPDTGWNSSAETGLSTEFHERLKALLEDAIGPRVSGKKILVTTISLATLFSGVFYGGVTANKAYDLSKLVSENSNLAGDKEAVWYLVKDALNPLVIGGKHGTSAEWTNILTGNQSFEYASRIVISNMFLKASEASRNLPV